MRQPAQCVRWQGTSLREAGRKNFSLLLRGFLERGRELTPRSTSERPPSLRTPGRWPPLLPLASASPQPCDGPTVHSQAPLLPPRPRACGRPDSSLPQKARGRGKARAPCPHRAATVVPTSLRLGPSFHHSDAVSRVRRGSGTRRRQPREDGKEESGGGGLRRPQPRPLASPATLTGAPRLPLRPASPIDCRCFSTTSSQAFNWLRYAYSTGKSSRPMIGSEWAGSFGGLAPGELELAIG